MKIERKFTKPGQSPFDTAPGGWTTRASRISNPDGSVVFEMPDAEVPKSWSQLATDIMVSKYFRKAGVPQTEDPCALPGDSPAVTDDAGEPVKGPEHSARQVIHRLAGCWRHWGQKNGYFDTPADGEAFYDELVYMMLHQMCAPNSPQWFNTGLNWAYGISGPAQGHFVAHPKTGAVSEAKDAYTHPQPHACFIQSVGDDLVNSGGIMDLWVREARLFKYGSGTGTNFSRLRAENEPLSGGGKSSGLMSWLKIGDRAAAAIKSGGTTRRAAKMVCLDMDHPDIERFVNWKVREEIKVAAMVEGLKLLKKEDESIRETADGLGLTLDYDFNGEAYQTVSGQNSNNSIRIPDEFFEALDGGDSWKTYFRTTGELAEEFDASALWDSVGYAAWRCADPGVQFDTTINAWHTCPSAGRINASNPCSEYMFLDNTACNLASLNVLKFYDGETRAFDIERFEHAVDLWTIVLEISVLMASFPSRDIAELSYRYRTLGLGYANLGAMLMRAGIPYDSEEARGVCACITSLLTGRSYRQSAAMARQLGAFPGFHDDKRAMMRVMRNHQRAAKGVDRAAREWEDLSIRPVPIDHELCASGRINLANTDELLRHAVESWNEAATLGEKHGFRNAQVSVIAPTGTIGLLMDCDTTGVEPDFALVKFKKLAGGGYFKIANASVDPALEALGYSDDQRRDIRRYLLGALHLEVELPAGAAGAQPGETLAQWLRGKGMAEEDLDAATEALPGVFELGFAFNAWSLGDAALQRLGIDPAEAKGDPSFNLLRRLGLTAAQIEALNVTICGTQTVEGAPHLRDEHLPVFDCASTCGRIGTRYIAAEGHIRMMAAAQPFISGAISKTINLPNSASVDDIKGCYRLSWELGLKANALYRDGCKLSQPLSNKSDKSDVGAEEVDLEQEVDVLGESDLREEVTSHAADLGAAVARGDVVAAREAEIRIVHRPMRRRLPDTRRSLTHKFNVAGHEGYLTVGLYDEGAPGELFITMAKEGSTIGGLMDSLGTAVSVALQYGVPVESLVNKFAHQRFEPAGMTTNRDIPFAKSLVDYIFRFLGMEFVEGFREINAPQRSNGSSKATEAAAAVRGGRLEIGANDSDEDDLGDVPHAGAGRLKGEPRSSGRSVPRSSPQIQIEATSTMTRSATLSLALDSMGDAPPCDNCGTITVRSGTCYKCLNCGNSMGCS
jgi:ribonucleoside-diphosphate reductase alpha chain